MSKKVICLILLSLIAVTIFGCKGKNTTEADTTPPTLYKIGVCFSDNFSYNNILMDGFREAITDELPGASVSYTSVHITDYEEAFATAADFISDGDELILTVGKSALLGTAAATSELPVISTDVTDIKRAIESISTVEAPVKGKNITGISGMPNIADQLALAIEVTPNIKSLAILYGAEDTESIPQIDILTTYLNEAGIKPVIYQFSEIKRERIKRICKKCDAIFIPAKSTLFSGAKKISRIAAGYGIPTIGGDVKIGAGTLVCLSPDYYEIGYNAGKQAAQILGDSRAPSRIGIMEAPEKNIKYYNPKLAKRMGLSFPKSFEVFDL